MFHIRNKLTKFLLKLSFFFAKIIAVAPVQFDYRTGEVITSPQILVYTACIHIVCISIIPIASTAKFREIELFQRKPLTESISNVDVFARSLAVFITMIWNWVQRQRLNGCIEDFYSIQRKYFAKLEASSCLRRQFDILVTSKFIIAAYQIFAAGFVMFSLNPSPSAEFYVLVLYVLFVQSMLIVTPNFVFLAMLLARVRFRILNEQLCMTVRQIKLIHADCQINPSGAMRIQISCDLADKIDEIARCHRRNFRFVKEVTRIYQFPILLIVATFFITNIVYAYFLLILIRGKDVRTSALRTLITAENILVNVVELYLLLFVCDSVVEEADYPGVILRELTELYPAVVDERLESTCEEFLLNLMREKMDLQLCGMLFLDRKLILMMASSMVVYLLILVQFDYRSLFH